jgi:hypothetical protein
MKSFLKASWKRALFALMVFAFVGLGAAATSKAPAPTGNHEGKVAHAEKAKKKGKKKTQAEVKGNKTLAAQSETDNENLEKPRETAEEGNEKAE